MIEARGLTKRYGDKLAVDELSFTVEPGRVTGFLGPNGAGKTTTMRMILGLDQPTGGLGHRERQAVPRRCQPDARGRRAARRQGDARRPQRLQPPALPGPDQRPARGAGSTRCSTWSASPSVARKRSKGFSLGMGQRLGIAAALLGDPAILMFDEPVNGLDPEGILWIRNLHEGARRRGPHRLRLQPPDARDGARPPTTSSSSGEGRLIADCTVEEFIERNSGAAVRVRTPQPARCASSSAAAGGRGRHRRRTAAARARPDRRPGRATSPSSNEVRLHELTPWTGLPRGGLHGADGGERRVPRRAQARQAAGRHRSTGKAA